MPYEAAVRLNFANAVKAMARHMFEKGVSYLPAEKAAPFVDNLPEFWREPARVMASSGYYAGADGWMEMYAEDYKGP